MAFKIRKDDRPYWDRSSYLGEHISNGNWIIALILLTTGGFALYSGWIVAAIPFAVAGMLSFVWNPGVAKTAIIIGGWIVVGSLSAWLLGLLCNSMFGMPALGHAAGLAVGIIGVIVTID